jgi:adenosylhomocysteine nucleosidase
MMNKQPVAIILISANQEWRIVLSTYPDAVLQTSPFGAWFSASVDGLQVIFMHGGWGKISAAASTQYAVQAWNPRLMVNLGTCGGLYGQVNKGDILLVTETVVYDIFEQMGDAAEAVRFYSTTIDPSWLKTPFPQPVRLARLVSADRDIIPADVARLRGEFDAIAADWESGAIAWVALKNNIPCLILRGVSDLVGEEGGEAYGQIQVFHSGTLTVMTQLLQALPGWLACASII